MTGPSGYPIDNHGRVHLSDAELAGYLDHDLTPDERRRAEAHLDQCPSCRGEVVAISRITQATASAAKGHERRSTWWVPAAAAVVVATLALPRLTNRPRATDTSERAQRVTDVGGRARFAIVAPANDSLVATPLLFTWHATHADVYRFSIGTETGDSVWTTDTADTTIALPDSIALQPGRAYFWRVDGIRNGIAASTGSHRLRILAR